nr:ClpXP protease specificity-enhancing factor SspB [uncultured Cohaesibacter sp.]
MSEDLIRYDILAQDALRGVVKTVLTEVARTGLPGEHHFYITFNTQAPGVRISPRLLEKYPDDMTIVLQHQFWDLQANDQAIEIGLSFDGIPEKLYIPYTSIITFIDPSVHFSLQFEIEMDDEDEDLDDEEGDEILTVMAPGDEAFSMPEEPSEEASGGKTASEKSKKKADSADKSKADKSKEGAEVVSLDAFRKK